MGLSIFQSLLNVSTLAKGSISCIVPAITLNHMKYTVSSLVKDQNVSFVIPPFRYNFVYLFFFLGNNQLDKSPCVVKQP